LVASVGSPEVLKAILKREQCLNMLDEESVFEGTPLKDAIVRGNKEACDILLDHGANPSNLWESKRCHALHVCAYSEHPAALDIAKRLLHDDPPKLQALDRTNQTPLHEAVSRGRDILVKYMLQMGAELLKFNDDELSPLGVGIESRFVGVTRMVCREHKQRRVPQVAAGEVSPRPNKLFWKKFRPIVFKVSALKFLLNPPYRIRRSISLNPGLSANQLEVRLGCYDHPFSEPSLRILKVLLREYHYEPYRSIRAPFHFYYQTCRAIYSFDSGLYASIRTGNQEAIEMILTSE